jgi:hypothetical protein
MATRWRWALRFLGGLFLLLVLGLGVVVIFARHTRPEGGITGAEADALAHEIERSVGVDAWKRTGAVRFTFGGMSHLWDLQRNYSRERWGKYEVFVNVGNRTGRAFVSGRETAGKENDKLVDKAYRQFINDSFWLNPLPKLFDEGVTRWRVTEGGRPALLLRYASGGVTPGDSYLWILGEDHRPRAWRMWVQVLPIPGLEASWEGWTTLSTGALVSTRHKIVGATLAIDDVVGAATLAELEGGDPFAGKLP